MGKGVIELRGHFHFMCYHNIPPPFIPIPPLGSFNNYLDKIREGGQKMSDFVHAQSKNCPCSGRRGGVGGGVRVTKWQNYVHVVVE